MQSSRSLGVCSWSLQMQSLESLSRALREEIGVTRVQLALDMLLDTDVSIDDVRSLTDEGIEIISGMMAPVGEDYSTPDSIKSTGGFAPEQTWAANKERARRLSQHASNLGISLVTMHAGAFADESGQLLTPVIDRIREIAAIYASEGIMVGFETGQETAQATLHMIEALGVENVGINFDPANMLLYNSGDPIEALELLLPRVMQVHIKDAIRPTTRGQWGTEVVVGTGDVDWDRFFDVLDRKDQPLNLIIEREDGDTRIADVCIAADFVRGVYPRVII